MKTIKRAILSGMAVLSVILLPALAFAQEAEMGIFDAVREGDVLKAKELIEKGKDPNVKDQSGNTPLIKAALAGKKDVVEMLIALGADVNAVNKAGDNPLLNAAYRGHKDIVEILLSKGADPNAKDRKGNTPLQWAIKKNRSDIVELLKKHGARE